MSLKIFIHSQRERKKTDTLICILNNKERRSTFLKWCMRASESTLVSRDSFRDHGSGIQLLRTLELSKDCEHSEDEFISTGTLKEIENQSESW